MWWQRRWLLASTDLVRTVKDMRLLLSRAEHGHHVFVRIVDGVRVVGHFDDDGSERDITEWTANLILSGLAAQHEVRAGLRGEPTETVEIAKVRLDGSEDGFIGWFLHLETGTVIEFGWHDAAELVGIGIAEEITAAVASDIDVPDTAEGIDTDAATDAATERWDADGGALGD
jgi:hypothetical protein